MGFWSNFKDGKLWVKVKVKNNNSKNNELISFLHEAEKAGFELLWSSSILSNYLNKFYSRIKKEIVITYKDSLIFTNEEKFNEALKKSENDLLLWDWDISDALILPAFEICSDRFDVALNTVLHDNLCDDEEGEEEDNNKEDEESLIELDTDEIHICSCKDRTNKCNAPSDYCSDCDDYIKGKTTSGIVDNHCEDETEDSCEAEDKNEKEKIKESLNIIYNHLQDYGYDKILINFFDSLADEIEKDFNSEEDYYE